MDAVLTRTGHMKKFKISKYTSFRMPVETEELRDHLNLEIVTTLLKELKSEKSNQTIVMMIYS